MGEARCAGVTSEKSLIQEELFNAKDAKDAKERNSQRMIACSANIR